MARKKDEQKNPKSAIEIASPRDAEVLTSAATFAAAAGDDHEPPRVDILSPAPGTVFRGEGVVTVPVRVGAEDNQLNLKLVEWFVDGACKSDFSEACSNSVRSGMFIAQAPYQPCSVRLRPQGVTCEKAENIVRRIGMKNRVPKHFTPMGFEVSRSIISYKHLTPTGVERRLEF